MKISIVCPLYNAEKYLKKLHESILSQNIKYDIEVLYVLTESNDNSEAILKALKVKYFKISKEEFSHSKTREMMAGKAQGDIIVFISQDVKLKDEFWLVNLVAPIVNDECEASFSRQLPSDNFIEKYIREKNYPTVSRVVSKEDIANYGLMTFFYSDAASAIKADIFKKLKGYDEKDFITNEDMYLAYKLITNGYRIKYCSDSQVIHSHRYTFKELFNRYFDTGVFMKQNPYFLNYKANSAGLGMLKYTLKNAVKEKNMNVVMRTIPDFTARFAGSYLGKRYDKLSSKNRIKFSMNKKYWK